VTAEVAPVTGAVALSVIPATESVAPPAGPAAEAVTSVAAAVAPIVLPVAEAANLVVPTVTAGTGPSLEAPVPLAEGTQAVAAPEIPLPIMPVAEETQTAGAATWPIVTPGTEDVFVSLPSADGPVASPTGALGIISTVSNTAGDTDANADDSSVLDAPPVVDDSEITPPNFSPTASGLLANIVPFDPKIFELAMQPVFERVSDLGEEFASLAGPNLFPLERPSLVSWLMAAAVAACAYEMARRQMQYPQPGQEPSDYSHGPTTMWFPDSHGH
jgi:hypothetical protein